MKLTRIAAAALIAILSLSAIACSSNSEQESMPGFTTYTENINGFSIFVPDGWDSLQMDTIGVIFHCPQECGELRAAVAVTVVDTAHSSVQDYYADEYEQMFEPVEGGNNLISKEDLTVDGIPAIKMIFTFDMPTPYGDVMNIENMECIFIYKQMLWTVLMQCDSTCWDTYESTFNTMLDSFQVLD